MDFIGSRAGFHVSHASRRAAYLIFEGGGTSRKVSDSKNGGGCVRMALGRSAAWSQELRWHLDGSRRSSGLGRLRGTDLPFHSLVSGTARRRNAVPNP